MSKGIGKTQQAILDALEQSGGTLTVVQLAERLGASPRQLRTAARSLEGRGLVVITRETIGWRGLGEYGPLAIKSRFADTEGIPTARVVRQGEPWPYPRKPKPGTEWLAARDTELFHTGMPVAGLRVWLPQVRAA